MNFINKLEKLVNAHMINYSFGHQPFIIVSAEIWQKRVATSTSHKHISRELGFYIFEIFSEGLNNQRKG